MILIKRIIYKLLRMIFGIQRLIKFKEHVNELYQYPYNMLGRVLPSKFQPTDILVFAAHPDDEVLGLSTTLLRHRRNNDKVTIVYITDGTGRGSFSWQEKKVVSELKANKRYKEGAKALSLINISQDNLLCLGIPDGGTQRYLNEMANDIFFLINQLNPRKIYTHCIECGHFDHDFTSFVVRTVCEKIGYLNIYEWAEYSPSYPLGTKEMKFSSGVVKPRKQKVHISNEERLIKKNMLALHDSQDVEQFYLQGEAIRKSKTSELVEELSQHHQYRDRELKRLITQFQKEIGKIIGGEIKVDKSNKLDCVR